MPSIQFKPIILQTLKCDLNLIRGSCGTGNDTAVTYRENDVHVTQRERRTAVILRHRGRTIVRCERENDTAVTYRENDVYVTEGTTYGCDTAAQRENDSTV